MKSRSDRFRKILAKFFADLQNDFARASYRSVTTDKTYDDAREKIIALFKECVPEVPMDERTMWREGWEECREETLKNIEEIKG